MIGVFASAVGLGARRRARAAAALGAARASGSRCRKASLVVLGRTVLASARRRHRRDDARGGRPGDPRRAHVADRRDHRPARPTEVPTPSTAAGRSPASLDHCWSASAIGIYGFSADLDVQQRGRDHVPRRLRDLPRARRVRTADRPPALERDRPAAARAVRRHRDAGPRQRDAEPAPDVRDRGRADRRARARRARRDLRRLAEDVGPRRARPTCGPTTSSPRRSSPASRPRSRTGSASVPGVKRAVAFRWGDVRIDGNDETVNGANTAGLDDVLNLKFVAGDAVGSTERRDPDLGPRRRRATARRSATGSRSSSRRSGRSELRVAGHLRDPPVLGCVPDRLHRVQATCSTASSAATSRTRCST